MDSADYTELALRLANADLTGLDGLRAALHDEPWWSERVHEHDLEVLRTVAAGLRAAFDAMIEGDAVHVQAATNELLERHPPRPRLSGHTSNWHVHVAGPDAPPATEVAAASAWGLAQGVVAHGTGRWGRCQAADCATYFLDTSTNQAKRFCSPRCANRVHVAAFRARRKT
ncbi:CGNR zinc finger domain-containing protein [Saccharopolyspora gloriosae]|uniref:CGNR zinc finger domain-containing protein n=1 Tax=Saccharopolyspora gloriosae TaxID=455344 RepID=UPI001FB6EE8A|nr:CGNR zinc finger domain-containing protein [Saccharopolyspora gloriosae]